MVAGLEVVHAWVPTHQVQPSYGHCWVPSLPATETSTDSQHDTNPLIDQTAPWWQVSVRTPSLVEKAVKSFVLTAMDTQCGHRFASSAHKASAQTALCGLTEHLVCLHGLPGSTVLTRKLLHSTGGAAMGPCPWNWLVLPSSVKELAWGVEGWQALFQAQLSCQLGGRRVAGPLSGSVVMSAGWWHLWGEARVSRRLCTQGCAHKAVYVLTQRSVYGAVSLAAMIRGCGHQGLEMGVAPVSIIASGPREKALLPVSAAFCSTGFEVLVPRGECFHEETPQWFHWTGSKNCHSTSLGFSCLWINRQGTEFLHWLGW